MKCHRCNGFLYDGNLMDIQDELGQIWIHAIQCLNCGEVIDPVIWKNRQQTIKPLQGKARFSKNTPVASRVA